MFSSLFWQKKILRLARKRHFLTSSADRGKLSFCSDREKRVDFHLYQTKCEQFSNAIVFHYSFSVPSLDLSSSQKYWNSFLLHTSILSKKLFVPSIEWAHNAYNLLRIIARMTQNVENIRFSLLSESTYE